MAFDFGFDFRNTSGYVTDPTYATFAKMETYPHTYSNADGLSINGGWESAIQGIEDASATNDPRIAGRPYAPLTLHRVFRVDLDSGSAPGAGNYNVDLAMGDNNGARAHSNFTVTDTDTIVIDGRNGTTGYSTAAHHYIDASLADVTATTTWTGTPASVTFATTIARLHYSPYNTATEFGNDYTMVPHFRLTLQGGASQSVVPVLMAQYRARG